MAIMETGNNWKRWILVHSKARYRYLNWKIDHFLDYLTILYQVHLLYSVRWYDCELWIIHILERNDSVLLLWYYPNIYLKGSGKPRKPQPIFKLRYETETSGYVAEVQDSGTPWKILFRIASLRDPDFNPGSPEYETGVLAAQWVGNCLLLLL
jgi:hypothetical protein